MTSQIAFSVFLAFLIAERFYELRISRRHADLAMSRGAVEVGQKHFRWMKLLHTGFFFACLCEVWLLPTVFHPALGLAMFTLVALSQGLRYWAIRSLGVRWNVRVIVEPNAPAIRTGPYRWIRHPNYLAVIVEGFAVPLVHGAWRTAVLFSALNAWMLWVRIQCEERALDEHCSYSGVFGGAGRFVPSLRVGRHRSAG